MLCFTFPFRGFFIKNCDDFIETLFEAKEDKRSLKEVLEDILTEREFLETIPIPLKIFLSLFSRKRKLKDVFKFLTRYFKIIKNKGKQPILILDELQVLKDINVNEPLIYKLFNFLIHLTKETRLCYVFLFINEIYEIALLHGRCDYILVDDLSKEVVENVLRESKFSEEEMKLVWEYFGGKPMYVYDCIIYKDRLKEYCREKLNIRKDQILSKIKYVGDDGIKVRIREKEKIITKKDILEVFEKFRNKEEIDDFVKKFLVDENILFVDPKRGIIKPQGRLELLAIREIIKNFK